MHLVATFVMTGLFICVLCGLAFGAVVALLFGPSSDILLISTGCAAGIFTALILGRLCLALLNDTLSMVRASNAKVTKPEPISRYQNRVILDLTDAR